MTKKCLDSEIEERKGTEVCLLAQNFEYEKIEIEIKLFIDKSIVSLRI
jgi:hypothetical protein